MAGGCNPVGRSLPARVGNLWGWYGNEGFFAMVLWGFLLPPCRPESTPRSGGSTGKACTPPENGINRFLQEIRQLMDAEYPGSGMVAEWSGPKDALDHAFRADFFHWFRGYNDLFQKESWRILNGHSSASILGKLLCFISGKQVKSRSFLWFCCW